jgi:hypothetical protein
MKADPKPLPASSTFKMKNQSQFGLNPNGFMADVGRIASCGGLSTRLVGHAQKFKSRLNKPAQDIILDIILPHTTDPFG